jgi:hypothetical protein
MTREAIGRWVRERGYKKRRNVFRRVRDEYWGVVDFQASQWGSRDDVRFTRSDGRRHRAQARAQGRDRLMAVAPPALVKCLRRRTD